MLLLETFFSIKNPLQFTACGSARDQTLLNMGLMKLILASQVLQQ
jgi:hypothetical protein